MTEKHQKLQLLIVVFRVYSSVLGYVCHMSLSVISCGSPVSLMF